jgi:hypothetical protein
MSPTTRARNSPPESRLAALAERPLILAGCLAAVLLLVGLVALLLPAPARPEPVDAGPADRAEAAPEAPDPGAVLETAPEPSPASPAPVRRPAAGSAIPALVSADLAFDAGNYEAARDLYLELLLTGGGLGGPDWESVSRWAHGRMALAVASLVRAPGKPLLDEPVLTFREEAR